MASSGRTAHELGRIGKHEGIASTSYRDICLDGLRKPTIAGVPARIRNPVLLELYRYADPLGVRTVVITRQTIDDYNGNVRSSLERGKSEWQVPQALAGDSHRALRSCGGHTSQGTQLFWRRFPMALLSPSKEIAV